MVLVIGGGVSGLMTAWILLDKGYRVTIVAEEWRQRGDKSPDKKADRMTSQIAGALWEYPPGGCGLSEIEVPVLAYSTLAQYRTWALQSFLFYKLLAENDSLVAEKNRFGARMITLYQFFQKLPAPPPSEDQNPQGERTQEADPEWKKAKNAIKYGPNDFNIQWGYRHQAPVVDTDVAMEFLMNRVRDKGATLETRHIREDLHLQERELMDDFKADIIVNASGLGAKVLASDNQVFPVRGAVRRMTLDNNDNAALDGMDLVLLPAQYDTRNQPGKTVFIVPRNEKTTVVGSIIQRNNWDLALTLESPEVEDMWKRAHGLVPALQTRKPSARPLAQGLRPFSHSNVRVSADNRTASCRVVHNYGHGGSGWTLAVGCAWTCVTIVERMLHRAEAGSVANANVWGLGGHRGAD
ncbi:uncharacterized protein B0H64DRAFT_469441 [Chaetomium fimeti]|uniref:FAD dependent oxidoreductase domain-containing protein n=1 Tax=Chaetomium fimeti TaxID=1854472 RepID=A0AAE0H9T6_9PEZI|nr:hypothetical protein B0H64DRAFT_469441 [Chaetomium fimeti]